MKYLICLLLLVSCAHHTEKKTTELVNIDEFTESLPTTNTMLAEKIKAYELNGDLSTLSMESYESYMEKRLKTRAGKLIPKFRDMDEHTFVALNDKFCVCFKSTKEQFVTCDDSSTTGLDKIVRELPLPEVSVVLNQLNCKK